MLNQNEKEFKWSQWDQTGMIRCGIAPYKQIMQWMRELGMEAKEAVKHSEKNHAVYGVKKHDDIGRITEIRLYCEAYLDDAELDVISKLYPMDTLYVAHK